MQEYYDSITAYHNAEKFSYNQVVDQNHEMKFQESDYNIEKFKQIKIDENFFTDHINIIEIICWNCKLIFTFNNQLHQHFRLENCEKISKNNKKWQNSTAFFNSFIRSDQSNIISFNCNDFIILNVCKILQDYKIHNVIEITQYYFLINKLIIA